MQRVINAKFTNKYTSVYCDSDYNYNAPNHFIVRDTSGSKLLASVDFQEGPIKEVGVNGIANEDALLMVLTRLLSFQNSEYACTENEEAIQYIEKAVESLRKRTNKREEKGIEGTSII